MNIISRIGIFASLLLVSCIQGPWSFWPKDPPLYRGIWAYAHVVAGKPLQEICFEPIIPLDETSTRDFAFYLRAEVQIGGTFNGSTKTLDLTAREDHPNCFDGPSDQIPETGKEYQLRAEFDWDSSGTRVTSVLTATTNTPRTFQLRNERVLGSSKLDTVFRNDSIVDLLVEQFGEEIRTQLQDPAKADTLAAEYQTQLVRFLKDFTVPLKDGDTVSYLNPPNDLASPFKFDNTRSDDVNGVLMAQYFSQDGGRGLNSFDLIAGQDEPDSSEWANFGTRHRLWFLESFYNEESENNLIDTITLSNVYLYLGDNTFYFYAVPKEYSRYLVTAIQGAEDSRIRAKSNIRGGYGIFSGMVVDSIRFHVKALPNSRTYPLPRTRWLVCRAEPSAWEDAEECRKLLPQFCADSLRITPECRAYAIGAALDSGLAWDSLMLPLDNAEEASAIRAEGEERWCIRNQFPSDAKECEAPKNSCLLSEEASDCKTRLWNWCTDLGWPIDSLDQCGSGFVSWIRLEDVQSPVLERERDSWCDQNRANPQCKF